MNITKLITNITKLILLTLLTAFYFIFLGLHTLPVFAETYEQVGKADPYCPEPLVGMSVPDGYICFDPNEQSTPNQPISDSSNPPSCWDKMRECFEQREAENNASGADRLERGAEDAGCVLDAAVCITPPVGQIIQDVVEPLWGN